jgi:hypothetical protein
MTAPRDETSIILRPTGFTRRVIGYAAVPFALGICAAGPIGIAVGVATLAGYVALCLELGRARLIVDGEGVAVQGAFSTRRLRWEQIERYSYVSLDPNNHGAVGAHTGVAGVLLVAAASVLTKKTGHRTFSSGRLVLYGAGQAVKIGARYQDLPPALDQIFARIHPRLPPSTAYGLLSFDGTTLAHAKAGALTIAEIDKVIVGDTGEIVIRKVGKRLSWATVPMAKVDNVMLLFERLIARGIEVQLSQAVFLAAPTLQLLAAATTARASLPAARVHRS